jgi:hypothetical protein
MEPHIVWEGDNSAYLSVMIAKMCDYKFANMQHCGIKRFLEGRWTRTDTLEHLKNLAQFSFMFYCYDGNFPPKEVGDLIKESGITCHFLNAENFMSSISTVKEVLKI